jgi:hypothetical protein
MLTLLYIYLFIYQGTIYSTEKGSSCFLTNTDSRNDTTINFQGIDYEVPAWSVSILPDCQDVEYNTAKVNGINLYKSVVY